MAGPAVAGLPGDESVRTEEGIFRYLAGFSAVTTLLGSGTGCRLYESETDADPALPYVVYEIQQDEREQPITAETPPMTFCLYTFACFGDSPQAAAAVADAIFAAFLNPTGNGMTYRGTMGGAGGVVVDACRMIARNSSVVPDFYTDRKLFQAELDIELGIAL